jgi:hypothetical protein
MKGKAFTICLISVTLVNCVLAQNDTVVRTSFKIEKKRALNSLQAWYIKGRVHTILDAKVRRRSSKIDTLKDSEYKYLVFDTNGLLRKSITATLYCDQYPQCRKIETDIFSYDPLGYKMKEEDFYFYYDRPGSVDTINCTWNDNTLVEYLTDGSGRKYKLNFCKYDEQGRGEKYETYDENGKVIEKHLFKQKGGIITEQVDASGQIKSIHDTNGILIQMNKGLEVYTYKYKYDKKGNWTILKEYMGRKRDRIERREITYY